MHKLITALVATLTILLAGSSLGKPRRRQDRCSL